MSCADVFRLDLPGIARQIAELERLARDTDRRAESDALFTIAGELRKQLRLERQ